MAETGFMAGSIVAKLFLDKTGWNSSVKAVTADQKKLEQDSKALGQSMQDMGKKMAVAGAVITGAFTAMIYKTAEYGELLHDTAQKTGVSVEVLSGFKLAADKVGLSIDDMAKGFKFLSMNMVEASSAAGDGAKLFDAMGIKVKDSTGKLRDSGEIMLEVADRFASMEDGAQKTTLAVKLFGKSGIDMIPILNLGSKGLREQRDLAEKLGVTFTTQGAAAADKFRDSLDELKASGQGLGKSIGETLIPMATDISQAITGVIAKISEWTRAHPGLTQAVGTIGISLGGALTVMGTFIYMAGSMVIKLGALSTALGTTKLALLGTAGAVTALATVTGFYIIKLFELKAAKDAAETSSKNFDETQKNSLKNFEAMMTAAGISAEKIAALEKKYKDLNTVIVENTKYGVHGYTWQEKQNVVKDTWVNEMIRAIQVGKEDVEVQKALIKGGEAHNKTIEEQMKALGLLGPIMGKTDEAAKKYSETMKALGIESLGDVLGKTTELLALEKQVQALYDDKKISTAEYAGAIKNLNEQLGKLGSTTKTQVLPPARDLSKVIDDIKPKIGELPRVLEDVYYGFSDQETMIKSWSRELEIGTDKIASLLIPLQNLQILLATGMIVGPLDFGSWLDKPGGIKSTTKSMTDIFSGGMNDIARAFGDTFSKFVEEGFNFKTLWEGIWTSIKDSFFRILGEMATKFVTDFLGGLVKNAAKAAGEAASSIASTATSAVKGISDVLTGGLATAIGSFAGTFLAGVLAGGPSKHQQDQVVNDQKDSRNFLADIKNWMFSAGSGFGGAVWDYLAKFEMEKFDGLKGSIDLSRDSLNPKVDEANGWLRSIDGRGGDIARAIGDLKSAAGGAVSTTTELVAVHGTPANPEYILPAQDLSRIVSEGPERGAAAGPRDITINVNMNGQMITDREYTRARLIPEIIQAARSGLKAELQAALGVA